MRHLAIVTLAITALSCGGARPGVLAPKPEGLGPVGLATAALGEVEFATSCSAEAQEEFEAALALLHHMMYAEAGEAFDAIAGREPDCAMAHWGVAISAFHPIWPDVASPEMLARGAAHLERGRATARTERERAWIEAAAAYHDDWRTVPEPERRRRWADAHRRLHEAAPEDVEAAAFHALALLAIAPPDDRSFAQQRRAAAILERAHRRAPRHPGVIHYAIHAHDFPGLAEAGVRYAEVYESIAPEVPHAAHMPSHLFIRIGDWDRANAWNRRSAAAARRHHVGDAISIHWAHAADYLVYGYLQTLQDRRAREVLEEIREVERYEPTFAVVYNVAAANARYAVERRAWHEAASLRAEILRPDIQWDRFPAARAEIDFARGLGAARSRRQEIAREALADLRRTADALAAAAHEDTQRAYWARRVGVLADQVDGWIAFADEHPERALRLQRRAADGEDAIGKNPVMPGYVAPARELLGEMLLATFDAQGALEAFERSLAESPNRPIALHGAARAARELGDRQRAEAHYRALLRVADEADTRRPMLTEAEQYLGRAALSSRRLGDQGTNL